MTLAAGLAVVLVTAAAMAMALGGLGVHLALLLFRQFRQVMGHDLDLHADDPFDVAQIGALAADRRS